MSRGPACWAPTHSFGPTVRWSRHGSEIDPNLAYHLLDMLHLSPIDASRHDNRGHLQPSKPSIKQTNNQTLVKAFSA